MRAVKRLSTRATTSIMQTLSTLTVNTYGCKRTTHQTQQKFSRLYFVFRFFTVNIFLRPTVKTLSFLRLTAEFLSFLRLTVNPIETLIQIHLVSDVVLNLQGRSCALILFQFR